MNVKVFDGNYFETETDTRFMLYEAFLYLVFFMPFVLWFIFLNYQLWYLWASCYIALVGLMFAIYLYRFSVTLVFKEDNLCIMRHWKKEMVVYHTTRDAFEFSQTKREKKHGLGTIYIFGTKYYFSGIRNFDAMKRYIETHFSQRGND